MALVVEDGTGKADAESLTSVAFFMDYHAKRGNTAAATLTEETVEQLLRKANDYFSGVYAGSLRGVPLFSIQALSFPRDLWPGEPPVAIQQAIAELALIAKSTPLMPSISRGKKRVKVGPLEVEYDGTSSTSTNFVAASLRIAPFLSGLVRGPFAKLVRT